MFDADCMLRDGNPAADFVAAVVYGDAGSVVDMGGPDLVPRVIQLHVPANGAGDTLDLTIGGSPTGLAGSFVTLHVFPQITSVGANGAVGEYFCEIKNPFRFLGYAAAISLAANFGNIQLGPVPAGRHDHP